MDGRKVKLDNKTIIKGKNRPNGGGYEGKKFGNLNDLDPGMILSIEGHRQNDGFFVISEGTALPYDFTQTDDLLKRQLQKTLHIDYSKNIISIGKNSMGLLKDTLLDNYITKIGYSLIPSYLKNLSERSENYIPFKFHIVIDSTFNACAYPDGNVFVNTGLLLGVKNPSQLATVIGHEISHVTNKHGRKSYEKNQKTNFLSDLASEANKTLNSLNITKIDTSILGLSQEQMIVMFKTFGGPILTSYFSRELEEQADRCGLILIEKAGYDPREASKMWYDLHEQTKIEESTENINESILNKLKKKGNNASISLYNSHPKTLERARNLDLLIALNYQEKDFSEDKVKFQRQEIEYKNIKEHLVNLLKPQIIKKEEMVKTIAPTIESNVKPKEVKPKPKTKKKN